MIEVTWADGRPELPDEAVQRAVRAALEVGGRPGMGLAVVFVDHETLRGFHEEHLGDAEPTDVMAFDLSGGPDAGDGPSAAGPEGEIYVSRDEARRVAAELGAPLERELLLYVVHGTLHLCGHEDADEPAAGRMRRAERSVLERLGLPLDPDRHG